MLLLTLKSVNQHVEPVIHDMSTSDRLKRMRRFEKWVDSVWPVVWGMQGGGGSHSPELLALGPRQSMDVCVWGKE